jgi:hypothetical protein
VTAKPHKHGQEIKVQKMFLLAAGKEIMGVISKQCLPQIKEAKPFRGGHIHEHLNLRS